ncbi:MAG: amino acid ABC transporter permease [Rhodospirillales bacterium]|nr:amino acid ABC transporter permease [Rhodospirillales bacterium]
MEFTQFLNELWIARGALWQGLQLTIAVSVLAIVLGTVLGLFVGMVLVYAWRPFKLLVRLYVDFIRGTPVFVLVLASFYILSVIGIQLTAFQAGVLAITVFCSSHVGEMVRGALQAIHRGQTEAAMAIGLTFRQTFQYVLMPQALRQILPTWVNAATEMVKASTLLSVIGVAELLLSTQQVISRNFLSLEFYFFAGLIYFVLNFSIERFGRHLERRLAVY